MVMGFFTWLRELGVYDTDGYDDDGYDRQGYDEEGYDEEGYDREGYDKGGFGGEFGYHKETGTEYDPEGYDSSGYNKEEYDRDGDHIEGNLDFIPFNIYTYPYEKAHEQRENERIRRERFR
jgi:hypothetical protein